MNLFIQLYWFIDYVYIYICIHICILARIGSEYNSKLNVKRRSVHFHDRSRKLGRKK